MNICVMSDLDIQNKQLVLREDLNVPIKNGVILSDKRIKAAVPSIKLALEKGAGIVLLSHLGRPEEGKPTKEYSLAPVAEKLSSILGIHVPLVTEYLKGVRVAPNECILCENVRFLIGEKENSEDLAYSLASLGDIYVMDAFATAHRSHASTDGAIRFAKQACAGPLMEMELKALTRILHEPTEPLLAIIGGSKVSTKLSILENLLQKVQQIVVGGGIANTFLKAAGFEIGHSLYEPELVATANNIMKEAKDRGVSILLPVDVVIQDVEHPEINSIKKITEVSVGEKIFDIGPETVLQIAQLVKNARTILWNGPLGVFEVEPFSLGSSHVAAAVADAEGYTIVGGGESVAVLEKYGYTGKVDYISTAGGAFLEMLEGKTLPAVAALEAHGLCK